MIGPQHYSEAEQLLNLVKRHPDSSDAQALATSALAHATLALAAATALSDPGASDGGMPLADYMKWEKAAATQPPKGGDAR